jgi:hypothetical protein
MEWLAKLLDAIADPKSAVEALPETLTGAVGDALPPEFRDAAANLLGQAPVQDLLQRGELPARWMDTATKALEAVPKDPGGFLDQSMNLLNERFRR